jgi:hypothetical protein
MKKNEFYIKHDNKVKTLALLIINRLYIYLQSPQFSEVFDSELEFYVFNGIVSMHLWLICQRLQNFQKSRAANNLIDEILKSHKKLSNNSFQSVDTLRKISKFRNIHEYYENQKNTFHWHFKINNPTVENHFLKIDALVWSHVFHEKIPRYDPRVYKMSHYLVSHYEKLKNYTFEDFVNLEPIFDLDSIPINYKDRIVAFNPPLDQKEFFNEKYSDIVYKKYYYEYRSETERDINHLKKTFIRYNFLSKFDKQNYYERSWREEDEKYDELRDPIKIKEFEDKMNLDYTNMNQGSILYKLFDKWISNFYRETIETCEREDLRREREEYNERGIRTIEDKQRFSEKLDVNTRESLYKYRDLMYSPDIEKENFKPIEMKVLHPQANVVVSRRKRKPLVDKIFKLNPY